MRCEGEGEGEGEGEDGCVGDRVSSQWREKTNSFLPIIIFGREINSFSSFVEMV